MANKVNIIAPKGLLRILILDLASRNPVSGVEISEKISKMTMGNWIPSPGSTYYILGNLVKNENLMEIYTAEKGIKRYVATSKGKALLTLEKDNLESSWKRSLILASLLGRLFSSKDSSRISSLIERNLNEISNEGILKNSDSHKT